MALKGKEYVLEKYGITLPNAYAKIGEVHLRGVICTVLFFIQKDRESVVILEPLDKIPFSFRLDRTKNLLEQAYTKAKETLFNGWEDDIVTEGETAPEVGAEEATEWY